MKENTNEQKKAQFPPFVNGKELYWTFWGQLCYCKDQKQSIPKILTLIENSLCIYFSTLAEYFEQKLDMAIKNYDDTLNKMAMINHDARKQNKFGCIQCGGCCWTWPCCVTQEEIAKIVEYLGVSESAFIENYTVMVSDIRTIRRREWEDIANTEVYWNRLYDINTPCVFYDEGSGECKIHNVKPSEGREYKCWEEEKKYSCDKIQVLRKKYNDKIKNLLGESDGEENSNNR